MNSRLILASLALFLVSTPAKSVTVMEAVQAYKFFDQVASLGGISCAFHMGANQCRRPSRCADGLGYVQALSNGLPSAAKAMKDWMGKSGLTRQCGLSLLGGNTGATFRNLETLAQFASQEGSSRADAIVRNPPPGPGPGGGGNTGAIVCIESDVPSNVTYSYQWGNGSQAQNTLSNHQGRAHWFPHQTLNSNQSPPFL